MATYDPGRWPFISAAVQSMLSGPERQWVYTPDAIVEHHVPVARASFSYFLKRNYLEGRGKLEIARLLGRQEKLQDERDYLHRTLPSGIAAGIRAALRDCKMSSSGWQSMK
jgi:glucosyl-dolichyl phosphate glucuronosyltransferase